MLLCVLPFGVRSSTSSHPRKMSSTSSTILEFFHDLKGGIGRGGCGCADADTLVVAVVVGELLVTVVLSASMG